MKLMLVFGNLEVLILATYIFWFCIRTFHSLLIQWYKALLRVQRYKASQNHSRTPSAPLSIAELQEWRLFALHQPIQKRSAVGEVRVGKLDVRGIGGAHTLMKPMAGLRASQLPVRMNAGSSLAMGWRQMEENSGRYKGCHQPHSGMTCGSGKKRWRIGRDDQQMGWDGTWEAPDTCGFIFHTCCAGCTISFDTTFRRNKPTVILFC